MIKVIRKTIRNTASAKKTKPRLFDAVMVDGTVYLEVKQGPCYEKIAFSEVLKQISDLEHIKN